ncbi:MAG: putative signal transduction protein with domain [Acidimicrobiales bacterium]|jgi:CBS domain-containing protein|nr:putative signal transduction protein with domain [Acidimicrobiales bacterium]
MSRDTLVSHVMTADPLTFDVDDQVEDAMRALTERRFAGAPVVDANGKLAGLLSDDDLILAESRLHVPTVLSILGAYIEWPPSQKHFEEDLRKAVGAKVGEVMTADPVTCRPGDTLEQVATLMHDHHVDRLPVVDDTGGVAGIITRGDLVRAMVTDR